MLLQKLEMQGFKSFPDKTVLEFGSGITAVVGPNGSGKSNIADAVKWVLGETSTKSLRGTKMEDVIFSGTSNRKSLGFAQVKLTLDNSDKTIKEYGDVLTVSRKYYRSGESEYYIDGKNVRRRDIHELFMDTGLGADGYSIVSQGQIDSIISAKNEDRRELFEEAAGISLFRHKRTEAERRLEAAEENMIRLSDIISELEIRVGPLKEQSEKAQKFVTLSNEKKDLEIGLWLNKIHKFTNDLSEHEHKIDATNLSYEQCENELKSIENDINKEASTIANINVEIDNIRSSAAKYEEEVVRSEGEISVIKARISHDDDTVVRLNNDRDALKGNILSIDEQINDKNAYIYKNNILAEEKKLLVRKNAEKMESLLSSENQFSSKAAEISKKMSEVTVALSETKIAYTKAESSVEEITKRTANIDDNVALIEKDVNDANACLQSNQKDITEAEDKVEELLNVSNGLKMKLETCDKDIAEHKANFDKISKTLSEKESRAKTLSDLEKNMEGYSGAVKAVVKAANSNILHGICSPLSMAIDVKKEYLTAIEVALGGALQNIITENEQDAKIAINYLKKNNLGRATFLPISRIRAKSLNETGMDEILGFVSIASDLVECDKKYREIVNNLLSRVVIAQDMDSALVIAKQYSNRFKIVTLDGQVINAGGSMTGGSTGKGLGVLSRKSMIDELVSDVKELKEKSDKLGKFLQQRENERKSLNKSIEENVSSVQKEREHLIRLQGEKQLVDDKIASLLGQKRTLINEKDNASEKINSYLEEQEKNKKLIEEAEKELHSLEDELKDVSDNTNKLSEEREKIRKMDEKINLDLTAIVHDINAAENTLNDLKDRSKSDNDKIEAIGKEIEEIEHQRTEEENRILEIESKNEELRSIANGTSKKITEKITERDSHEKHSAELRILEKEKIQEREHISGELVRLDERKIAIRKEYDEINDMLYEQYEMTRREAEGLNIVIKDLTAARKRLNQIKSSIKALGSINVGAIEEYKSVSERYEFMTEQFDDINKSKVELEKIITELTVSMSDRFLTEFYKINDAFKTCFADFFGGGKGEIILEDEKNCLESAIEIKIQPPGKSVQNINLFSGGEKSLAAMALLFSVLTVTPSPFCIYDEVEAALDEVNVERFAKYMRKMTDKTQFISITHRRGTMEEADVLYGVTMQEKGVSKLLKLESAQLAEEMGFNE